MAVELFLGIFVFVLITAFISKNKNRGKLLPGPRGLPFIGIYHQLDFKKVGPQKTFQEWAKIYGKTFCCQIGGKSVIITEDFDDMDFMFRKFPAVYNGRLFDIPDEYDTKIGFTNLPCGKKWKEVRSFITSILNATHIGQSTYDDVITGEFENICTYIKKKHTKKSFNPNDLFIRAVANILIYTLFQKRYPYEGATADKEIEAVKTLAETLGIEMLFVMPTFVSVLARMGFLPVRSVQKVVKASDCLVEICEDNILEHRQNFDEDKLRDVVDICLKQIEETSKSDGNTFLTQNAVNGALVDMFSAGLVSTSLMLVWTLLLVISDPEVKEKLKDEIVSVVGFERHPRLSDRDKMPFAKAVVQEALRYVTVAPLGVYHKVQEDTMFKGYLLPKNTMILPNLWGLHRDPKIFPEPDKFKPDRFINSKGNFIKDRRVAAFGIGIRSCPGEVLAMRELFIFLTSTVQKFDVILRTENPNYNGHFRGIGIYPPDFEAEFIVRKEAEELMKGD